MRTHPRTGKHPTNVHFLIMSNVSNQLNARSDSRMASNVLTGYVMTLWFCSFLHAHIGDVVSLQNIGYEADWKQFNTDQLRQGRSKLGRRTVGSVTIVRFTTEAHHQAPLHGAVMSTCATLK